MPTKNPRIDIVFDSALTAKKLVAQALELQEDYSLTKLGEERMKKSKGWVTHEDAWG